MSRKLKETTLSGIASQDVQPYELAHRKTAKTAASAIRSLTSGGLKDGS